MYGRKTTLQLSDVRVGQRFRSDALRHRSRSSCNGVLARHLSVFNVPRRSTFREPGFDPYQKIDVSLHAWLEESMREKCPAVGS